MKFGVVTSFGTVHDYVAMARDAEEAGWDGVFAWDDIAVERGGVFDPWVVLGAMAAVTERVTLGSMVFSLPRRRPWKVARETITLDNLSNGRLVVPVSLGGTWDGGYSRVSTEDPSRRVRAQKLDECLEILELAWSGETVSYQGTHYWMRDLRFDPRPVQRPRIPIWPIGAWPSALAAPRRPLGRHCRLGYVGRKRGREGNARGGGRYRCLDVGAPRIPRPVRHRHRGPHLRHRP